VRFVRRIDDSLAKVEGLLLVLLVLGVVLVAALQTLLRNAFDSGLDWADDAMRWATLWVAFLGASLATHRGKHIAIDVASRLLPRRLNRISAFATSLAAALVAGALAWGCWRFVRDIGSLEPPVFGERIARTKLQIIVPVSFAIMSLRFFLQALVGSPEIAAPPAPPRRVEP